ncbi:MAG: MFS transporter [Bacteroidetes bacterium HGW-Bacteroidetes-17]|nr:MAG: MFS transporter [Bacteroidetes bacterium HGW-Bacteroidetes-17]
MLKATGGKYFTLLNLYLAQSIPMSFFSTVMPVIMRTEHYSLTSIGLIQLIKLPWIIKFLWAPLVDKTGGTISKYKSWIFFSEIFYAMVIFGIAFLSLEVDFEIIIVLMLIAFMASATQDIATDAFAILILKKEERSIGNSMQSAGSFLGTLTGSGLLLIIYYYWGWQYLLMALAGFVLLALLPLSIYKGREVAKPKPAKPIALKDIGLFFRQKKAYKRIILLTIFYSGIIGILTMIKPWMVDLGFNIKEIGILSGIHGAAFGAAFSFAAGFLIKKLGKKRSILLFSAVAFLAATYFCWMTYFTPSKSHIILGIALIWAAYGMSTVIVYTISMDNVRAGREGTDFTIQIVITHLSSLLIAVSSGKIAHLIGYKGLFRIEFIVSLIVLASISFLFEERYYEENLIKDK